MADSDSACGLHGSLMAIRYLPPPPEVCHCLSSIKSITSLMEEPQLQVKRELEIESTHKTQHARKQELLENEIECPRCHDDMTLCSEFDNLFYFCEQCDFCLFTLKKN